MSDFLSSADWLEARDRALERDGHRCSIARILGGPCTERIHVHHLIPRNEGGDPLDLDNCLSVCSRHHPMLEALRRQILRKQQARRCRHHHRYDHARRECEARLARL